jgi:transcriptional regulator with XRE-family HTH domain
MAAKLGISQSAYKDIEIGKTDLKVKTLQQIAKILGIDFLDGRKNGKEQSLVVVNPENIYGDLNELRRKQDEMDAKLDEILKIFKGKK